jgi:basic membrane protein A
VRKLVFAVLLLVLGLSLVAAGAGKVALILDVGGRGDLSFNDMGFWGAERAAADFNLVIDTISSASPADYLPNVQVASQSGQYDLIIGVGFLLGDAMNTVAPNFPNQKYAAIDVDTFTASQPNIMNLLFKEEQMSALVGALGAMAAAYHSYRYVGAVLGMEIPVLFHFEAGYRYGMDWGLQKYMDHEGLAQKPQVGLLAVYTGSFDDIALGKSTTEAQLAQGAVAVYNVAGPLGIGDLEAITEYHINAGTTSGPPYYFGVDANQDWMGDGKHGVASGMKLVDVAVYQAIKSVVEGTFAGGANIFELNNGGVKISKLGDLHDSIVAGLTAVPPRITYDEKYTIALKWAENRLTIPGWIWEAVDELESLILSGGIVVPTANTTDEISAIRDQYPLK